MAASINCPPVRSNDRMPGKGSKGGQDMLRIGMLALAALLVTGGAKAQDNYPSQTVKIVIPSAQGPTSTAHLSAAQLEVLAGIKMLAVPYRGAQPALTDIIAGNVDMFFDTLATSVPLHRGGKLKILAVADLQRAKTAPELPTFS